MTSFGNLHNQSTAQIFEPADRFRSFTISRNRSRIAAFIMLIESKNRRRYQVQIQTLRRFWLLFKKYNSKFKFWTWKLDTYKILHKFLCINSTIAVLKRIFESSKCMHFCAQQNQGILTLKSSRNTSQNTLQISPLHFLTLKINSKVTKCHLTRKDKIH